MRTRIKICGLTCWDDAFTAVRMGADALGFIFVEESPRHMTPEEVAEITTKLPPFVMKVGVFKDHDPELIKEIARMCRLNIIQLHGHESPDYCNALGLDYIKAFRIKDERSLTQIPQYCDPGKNRAFLLDTFMPGKAGGTGLTFDWELAHMASKFGPVILSGGLHPGNVGQAILKVQPFAVDASSGVEIAPGKKDMHKLKAFIEQVHQTDRMIYGKRTTIDRDI